MLNSPDLGKTVLEYTQKLVDLQRSGIYRSCSKGRLQIVGTDQILFNSLIEAHKIGEIVI